MKAWRVPQAACDPLATEGAQAAALWSAGASAVMLDEGDLVGYFPEPPSALELPGGWEAVDERDHVAAYFETLAEVDLGPLVVAPSHRQVTLRAPQRVLWLDPGSAFGTGHHESTRLALRLLGDLDLRGRSVLDVGSGSGVLAIAADLLGAAAALGVDIDPLVLAVAEQNAAANGSRARFATGDFAELSASGQGPYDVLVANLYAELHALFAAGYHGALRPGGDLILAGILSPRDETLLHLPGFDLQERRVEGEWVALHLRRGG